MFMLSQFGYLNYIVQNYNHLPEVVVFSQGSLHDHLDLYPFRTFSHPVRLVEHLAHEAATLGCSQNYYDHRIGRMSAHRAFRLAVEYPHIVDSGQFFGQWFEANVRSPWVEDMTWFRNGVFGVNRNSILSRPKSITWVFSRNFRTDQSTRSVTTSSVHGFTYSILTRSVKMM